MDRSLGPWSRVQHSRHTRISLSDRTLGKGRFPAITQESTPDSPFSREGWFYVSMPSIPVLLPVLLIPGKPGQMRSLEPSWLAHQFFWYWCTAATAWIS